MADASGSLTDCYDDTNTDTNGDSNTDTDRDTYTYTIAVCDTDSGPIVNTGSYCVAYIDANTGSIKYASCVFDTATVCYTDTGSVKYSGSFATTSQPTGLRR